MKSSIILICAATVLGFQPVQAEQTPSLEQRLIYIENHLANVEERLATLEQKEACEDMYERALSYTTSRGLHDNSIPSRWNGHPFTVNVSDQFSNAQELLEIVGREAEKIYLELGYFIFKAGQVMSLPRINESQLSSIELARDIVPLDDIEIRCCIYRVPGSAYPWFRMILLQPNEYDDEYLSVGGASGYIVTHELYHILGFSHPDESTGVNMSENLNSGTVVFSEEGSKWRTISTTTDLENLACIYN